MALPTVVETWNFNQVSITGMADNDNRIRENLYQFKEMLKAGTGGWTITRSSGKNGGGSLVVSNSDNLLSRADVVYLTYPATGAHSWYVAKQAGMLNGNFQICIDHIAWHFIDVIVSPDAGFTGGDTSNRPTATDEIVISYRQHDKNATDATNHGINCMKTSNGKCTRLYISWGAALQLFYEFQELKNTPSWYTNKFNVTTAFVPTYAAGFFTADFVAAYDLSSSIFSDGTNKARWARYAIEGSRATLAPQLAIFDTADYNSEWSAFPISVVSSTTGSPSSHNQFRGFLGDSRDLWAVSDNLVTGDYFPGDGSKQFVVLGSMLHPWNGTSIVIT